MKMLLVAIFFMVSSASLLAQGYIAVCSDTQAVAPDRGDLSMWGIPPDTSAYLPPPQRSLATLDSLSSKQPASLTIQAVPEPSSFALGSLAFGLLAASRLIRKKSSSFYE